METKLLIIFLVLALFFPLVEAQTVLNPGQTTFSVTSILVSPIQLQGNPSYLNIYWNASYVGMGTGSIGTNCYLNCNPKINDCSYAQQCSYTGSATNGACTILSPVYNYYADNTVICKFFDPSFPDLPFEPYPNKTFRPVAFNVWFSPVSAVVGKEFNLQINVKNTGLFDDSYRISVTTPNPNILLIDPLTAQTSVGPLKGDSYLNTPETGFSWAKITVLADSPCVCISVSSVAKSDVSGSYDIDSTSCQPNCVQIKSKMASLPDFGLFGIIQIILLAAILILVKF